MILRKIELFLKYLSLFLLFSFGVSMVIPTFIASSSPYSFCYEIVTPNSGFFIDGVWYYQNVTGCVLIDEDDYEVLKKSNNRFKFVAVFGLVGWFFFNPDFRNGIKDKIKRFKQR